MDKKLTQPIAYCLYARKSSESDKRQAMSIDGQLKEMQLQAKRDKLNVVEIITESHSAKESGQRPAFNKLLKGIVDKRYNAILTWAPDRLSRNAGDLGRIVDLMDQGKLAFIKTYSQSFTNNPNEKFLLMILCSQAKLENDNRGINVKRGLRNKCEIGIRPGPAPIGYLNVMKVNRISTVTIDPERGPVIKEMFNKVANQGYSGRMIRKWLRSIDFRTRNNCSMHLSRIYKTLKNHFYYGEFMFGGTLYKGNHEPLITKQVFEKVQLQLSTVPRQWNKQMFPFKKICTCGSCGGSVTAEIKYKRLINGQFNAHVYYHCNRIKKLDCKEPYITETELIRQLLAYLPQLKLRMSYLLQECKNEIAKLQHLKSAVLRERSSRLTLTPHNAITNSTEIEDPDYSEDTMDIVQEYLQHVLKFGSPEERVRILGGIQSTFKLTDRKLILL